MTSEVLSEIADSSIQEIILCALLAISIDCIILIDLTVENRSDSLTSIVSNWVVTLGTLRTTGQRVINSTVVYGIDHNTSLSLLASQTTYTKSSESIVQVAIWYEILTVVFFS